MVVTSVLMGAMTVSVMTTSDAMPLTVQPLRFCKLAGHALVDLPLPGDEDSIVRYRTRLSIKRDNRLTSDEHTYYLCTITRCHYGVDTCLQVRCPCCGGMGWTPQELFDTWP